MDFSQKIFFPYELGVILLRGSPVQIPAFLSNALNMKLFNIFTGQLLFKNSVQWKIQPFLTLSEKDIFVILLY